MKFETAEIYSSLGKMRLSQKITAPLYGFGTADRNKQAKVFTNKEMAKTSFAGKNRGWFAAFEAYKSRLIWWLGMSSPGPAYDVRGTDYFSYQSVSNEGRRRNHSES